MPSVNTSLSSTPNSSIPVQTERPTVSTLETVRENVFYLKPMADRSATVKQSVMIRGQMPEPLPPALGTLRILPRQNFTQQSATVKRRAFMLKQMPEPLPPQLGATKIFPDSVFDANSATVQKDIFIHSQYPSPLQSNIGKRDLPGGFRKEAVLNNRATPTYDIVRGIVKIDDVIVMFNAWA
ncbi:hypothetical protein ACFL47_09485 [Candidatus Latescibacterota bacterium]